MTRQLNQEIDLPVGPHVVFALLHTPSSIRAWWSAARVIVQPKVGGIWIAAWGSDEDNPDYITAATIEEFDPPRRLVLSDYKYYSKTGPLPFEASFKVEFTVSGTSEGSILRVVHTGFPQDPVVDEFYAGCERGWHDTLESIRRHISSRDS